MVPLPEQSVTAVDDLLDADAIARARLPPSACIAGWWTARASREGFQRWLIGGLIALGLMFFVWSSYWI